jgi:hypothetical protein
MEAGISIFKITLISFIMVLLLLEVVGVIGVLISYIIGGSNIKPSGENQCISMKNESIKDIIDRFSQIQESPEFHTLCGKVECDSYIIDPIDGARSLYFDISIYKYLVSNLINLDEDDIERCLHNPFNKWVNQLEGPKFLGRNHKSKVFGVSDKTETLRIRISPGVKGSSLFEYTEIYRSPFIDNRDITDLNIIIEILRDPENVYGKRITRYFNRAEDKAVNEFSAKSFLKFNSSEKEYTIIGALNKVLKRRDFFHLTIFKDLYVNKKIENYVRKGIENFSNNEIVVFNRLLLEHIFGNGLDKSRNSVNPLLLDLIGYNLNDSLIDFPDTINVQEESRVYFVCQRKCLNKRDEINLAGYLKYCKGVFELSSERPI